jgi:predicted transcriptional regulator
MKKKILILVTLLIFSLFIGYNYIYKSHRNIAVEKAEYIVSVHGLVEDFNQSDSLSINKYLDKTIDLKGRITNIDLSSNSIMIDDKMNVIFTDSIPKNISENQTINVKGRFIGYDDLLEEFKMDQVSIIN